MIGKIIVGVVLFLTVISVGNWMNGNVQKKDIGEVTPTAAISSNSGTATEVSETRSVSQMSDEDVIRQFFGFISEGKISDAIAMQTSSMVSDEGVKEQWGVTWNSFEKISVSAISPSVLDPESNGRKTYRVDLDVRMKPGNQTLWTSGKETRWISVVREGGFGKIEDIATGP